MRYRRDPLILTLILILILKMHLLHTSAGKTRQWHPGQRLHQTRAEHHAVRRPNPSQAELSLAVAAPCEQLTGSCKDRAVRAAGSHARNFNAAERFDEARNAQRLRTLVVTELTAIIAAPTK